MRPNYLFILSIFFIIYIPAQNYSIYDIPDNLKEDNKIVIRNDETVVHINSLRKMNIRQLNVYSIFDSSGSEFCEFHEFYSEGDKVSECKINVYDASGKLIETIKKKDFMDQKVIREADITDNHILFYKYTPTRLPITLEFIYEIETENTAFIPGFIPIKNYNVGIENSSYQLINESGVNCRYKIYHPDDQILSKEIKDNDYIFDVKDFEGIEDEAFSPNIKNTFPYVVFSLDEFYLEGKKGSLSSWDNFGKWYYNELVAPQTVLSEDFKNQLNEVVAPAKNDREKVQLLYDYLQKNMRYVSIQLGIGGWKPMSAQEVQDVKYGDCKALSNFMMSSLKSVGIDSNITILQSSKYFMESFDPEFPKMQGNHAILNVPMEKDTIWLECTSNDTAFNYITPHNDNRYVLAVNENGGTIVKTPKLKDEQNLVSDRNVIKLDAAGNAQFSSEIKYSGSMYSGWLGLKYGDENENKKLIREKFDHLAGIEFNSVRYNNNKKDAEFDIEFDANVPKYAKKVGKNLLFNVVPYNRNKVKLEPSENRKTPLILPRGYTGNDTFNFILPANTDLTDLPENIIINDEKFGSYSLKFEKGSDNSITVNRQYLKKSGDFSPSDYNSFVAFINKIYEADQTKIIAEIQP